MQTATDRDQWEQDRADLITASDVSRLFCLAPADNEAERTQQRRQVVMEKGGLADRWSGNETSDLATHLEDAVINAARARLGWDIRKHGVLTADRVCVRLGATPDALIHTPQGIIACNVKVSAATAQEDCKPKKDGSPSGASFANGCPVYYQYQLQAEGAVMDAVSSMLLVLHYSQRTGLKLRSYPVPRNDLVVASIRREVSRAWLEIEALRSGKLRIT